MNKRNLLTLKNISCWHQQQQIVRNLSFHLNQNTIGCLLGPSGCGKTTILRAIAGFEPIRTGSISFNAQEISTPQQVLAPEQRHIGMVFQDYALFPHLNLLDNVCFGIRQKSQKQRNERGMEMLSLVGLEDLNQRFPHELSGGQQQRVALVRAMAPNPEIILLDEPFSNLDTTLRERLAREVREILKSCGISAILVTHDQHEAFSMADEIGILFEGRLHQWDIPYNLYHEPADAKVADFIGQGVLLPGTLVSPDSVETEVGIIQGNRAYPLPIQSAIKVLLRPDDIILARDSQLSAKISYKSFKGAETLYTLALPSGRQLLALFPSHQDFTLNERIPFRVDADHLIVFSATETASL